MYQLGQQLKFRGNVGTVVELLTNAVKLSFSNGTIVTVLHSEL